MAKSSLTEICHGRGWRDSIEKNVTLQPTKVVPLVRPDGVLDHIRQNGTKGLGLGATTWFYTHPVQTVSASNLREGPVTPSTARGRRAAGRRGHLPPSPRFARG